jgi:hypothetical protein
MPTGPPRDLQTITKSQASRRGVKHQPKSACQASAEVGQPLPPCVVRTFPTASRARGARRTRLATAPGKRHARITLTRTRRSSRRSSGGPSGGTVRAWAPLAALRHSVPRRRRSASRPRRPPYPPGAATISAKRASCKSGPPSGALQCEAGQDHPQGRCASHVIAYGHPCG